MSELSKTIERWSHQAHATLAKPPMGQACSGCGYCCAVSPCKLAEEFLGCTKGPCVALEAANGHSQCGLMRNPLGYIYSAANPLAKDNDPLGPAPDLPAGKELTRSIAQALGCGMGCDSSDDAETAAWPARLA